MESAAAADTQRRENIISQLRADLSAASENAVAQKERGDRLEVERRGDCEAAALRESALAKDRCGPSCYTCSMLVSPNIETFSSCPLSPGDASMLQHCTSNASDADYLRCYPNQ